MNERDVRNDERHFLESQSDPVIAPRDPADTIFTHLTFVIAIIASIAFARWFAIPLTNGGSVTTIWPATGIALGLILRFGKHFWPSLAIGNGITLGLMELDPSTFTVT